MAKKEYIKSYVATYQDRRISTDDQRKREEGSGKKDWETEISILPPPVIVNIRVGASLQSPPTSPLYMNTFSDGHETIKQVITRCCLVVSECNLPTSALQNARWGCAGEQLQASAISSTRHRNRMASVTKQLFTVQLILGKKMFHPSYLSFKESENKARLRRSLRLSSPVLQEDLRRSTCQTVRCTRLQESLHPNNTSRSVFHHRQDSARVLFRLAAAGSAPSRMLPANERSGYCGGQGHPEVYTSTYRPRHPSVTTPSQSFPS